MKKTRLFAGLLVAVLLLGLMPFSALATEDGGEIYTAPEEISEINVNESETLPVEGEPETVTVTVNIRYVEFKNHDSGGSHYNNANVVSTETQTFECTPNEPTELELNLPADGHVVDAQFNNGNTATGVRYDMDGAITLLTTPTANAVVTVIVGQQWTARVYVYNLVLTNGAYAYQFPNNATAATMLMPKGQDAARSFAATGAREPAYEDGNIHPAISGDYAAYEYSRRYYATYYDGATQTTHLIADSAAGVDKLADYGLQIDQTTGELASLDGQTAPAITGNQVFSLVYYYNLPGEAEQGGVYTYSFFEDAAGTFPYEGKNYRLDTKYSTQMKQDIGATATYDLPEVDGYVVSGNALYQFNSAGKWVPLAKDAFDFKVADGKVSVTTQRGYLAFYNYYDAAGTVTVNRVYDSAYSSQPVFDGQPDFTDTAAVKVALGKTYTADSASGRDGYVLVADKTEVVGSDAAADEKGSVTVTLPGEKDSAVTVTYYYYRQLETPSYPDPTYKITVEYVDMAGKELAPSYTVRKNSGTKYDVTEQAAKAIEDYAVDHVDGTVAGTIKGNVTVTVYYKADEGSTPVTPPETEIPEEETPKTDLPEIEIPGEETPKTDLPAEEIPAQPTEVPEQETEIVEPEVPLGNLPQTGTVLYLELPLVFGVGALVFSLALLGVVVNMNKKRKEENER